MLKGCATAVESIFSGWQAGSVSCPLCETLLMVGGFVIVGSGVTWLVIWIVRNSIKNQSDDEEG